MTLDEKLERARLRRVLPSAEVRRAIREGAGLTQRDVAEELGVSRPAVVRWEGGLRTPQGELLERYLRLLHRLSAETIR